MILKEEEAPVVAAKRSGANHPIHNRGSKAWDLAGSEKARDSWRPEVPRVLVHAVVDDSFLYQYLPAGKKFVGFCRRERQELDLQKPDTVDWALVWFFEFLCYQEKRDAQEGKNARSCMTHLYPNLKGSLPFSQRALRTWLKLQGVYEREPLCWAGAGLVCQAVGRRNRSMGYSMWAQLDSLLREQDIEHLVWEDVVVSPQRKVALQLGQLHRGETTKTGPKQGVDLLDRALSDWFIAEKGLHGGEEKVFDFGMRKYREVFQEAVVEVFGRTGASELEATPHVNRHSAAVHLLQDVKWSLGKVQLRGRWAEERSVRWYAHPHLAIKNESRLTAQQVSEGAAIWAAPGESFEFARTGSAGSGGSSYPQLNPVSFV